MPLLLKITSCFEESHLTRACLWVTDINFNYISTTVISSVFRWLKVPSPPTNAPVTALTAVRPIGEGQPLTVDGAVLFKAFPDFIFISNAVQATVLRSGVCAGTRPRLSTLAACLAAASPLTPACPTTINWIMMKTITLLDTIAALCSTCLIKRKDGE